MSALERCWTAWFGGLEVDSDDRHTVTPGLVADQAALHGLLNKVCDLGPLLISVRRFDPD